MGAGWQQFGPDSRVVTPVKRTGTVSGGTLDGNLILVGQGDMTMDGRTKPDGTVDFTNLDHNDANLLPGATLTPENPLTGLNKLAAAGAAVRDPAGVGERDRRRPAVGDVPARPASPITPIIINQNLIDFTTKPGEAGPDRVDRRCARRSRRGRSPAR